ncbi:MAG: GGDEF domain-containing phosphodiesterase [Pseudomonadota bacterium]
MWFRAAAREGAAAIHLTLVRFDARAKADDIDRRLLDIIRCDDPVLVLLDNWHEKVAQSVLVSGALACFDAQAAPHVIAFTVAQEIAAAGPNEYALKTLRWSYDFASETLLMSPALSLFFPAVADIDALTLERFLIALAGMSARQILVEMSRSIETGRPGRLVHRLCHPVLSGAAGEFVAQELAMVRPTTGAKRICSVISTAISVDEYVDISSSQTALTETKFMDSLQGFIRENRSAKEFAAGVSVFSIDRFEQMNVLLGRQTADALLELVAKRINEVLHGYEVTDGAQRERRRLLGRLGGAQFAIALEAPPIPATLTDLAQQILDVFQAPFTLNDQRLYLDVRAGISLGTAADLSADKVLSRANVALYQSFSDSPGSLRVFSPAYAAEAQERVILDAELRDALSQDNLSLRYMPIIDLATKQPIGAEALVRWEHPQLGLLSPDVFIPMAEASGVIADVSDWVLRRALEEFSAVTRQLPQHFRLAINVSSEQIRRGDLEKAVFSALYSARLPRECLTLELTETLMVENFAQALSLFKSLRAGGVRWSIDDFGTGFSSLSYLGQLPFDEIKLDRSFIQALGSTDEGDASTTLVDAVVSIARSHNADVVAEGIETPEQASILTQLGCDFGQGYAFSEPLDITELTEHLSVVSDNR